MVSEGRSFVATDRQYRLPVNFSAVVQVFGRRQRRALRTFGRPASEKRQGTKSREVGHRRCPRALWGFSRGVGLGESVRAPAPTALPRRVGVGDALNERSEGCRTGLAVSLRADLSTCSKRRLCWPSQPEWRASLRPDAIVAPMHVEIVYLIGLSDGRGRPMTLRAISRT